ncbi:hypothetical protein GCM10029978_081100 [Actinoallomurus acanthiterrae]
MLTEADAVRLHGDPERRNIGVGSGLHWIRAERSAYEVGLRHLQGSGELCDVGSAVTAGQAVARMSARSRAAWCASVWVT